MGDSHHVWLVRLGMMGWWEVRWDHPSCFWEAKNPMVMENIAVTVCELGNGTLSNLVRWFTELEHGDVPVRKLEQFTRGYPRRLMSSPVRGEAGGEQQMLNHYLQVARGPRYSRDGPEMGRNSCHGWWWSNGWWSAIGNRWLAILHGYITVSSKHHIPTSCMSFFSPIFLGW